GTGFGFSTRNFTETSGHNDVKIDNSKFPCIFQRIYHNSAFNLEWRNRYVIHNSMLEGVGIWDTFPDDPLDDEAVTEYTLQKEDVKRFLSTLDLSFSLRLRKLTVTYAQQRILGREFEVKNKVLPSPDFKPDPKYQTPALYGFG